MSGTEAESESYLDSSLVTGDIQSDSSSVKSCSLYGSCIFYIFCTVRFNYKCFFNFKLGKIMRKMGNIERKMDNYIKQKRKEK